jgi:signal transduction histidine kinase
MRVMTGARWHVNSRFYYLDKSLLKLIVILCSGGVLTIGTNVYLTNIMIDNQINEITRTKSNQVEILADDAQLRIDKVASALQTTSNLPALTTVTNASLISNNLHGIPSSAEQEKRQIAKQLLSSYGELDYVFFLLPNGDMYFLEPFDQQVNLTLNNFAFRDYYKGLMSTHAQYLSEAYVSNNNNHLVAAIATPVYSQTNHALLGIWVGTLNLRAMDESLGTIVLGKNANIIYVDQNGHIVANSAVNDNENTTISFQQLQSYQNATDGKPKTLIEIVGGTKMFISYFPLKMFSNTWTIICVQPYDDAFATVIEAKNIMLTTTIVILIILSLSGYYVYRLIHQKTILMEKLDDADTTKEEFATMVTHELKTPLVTINGYSEMLKERGILGDLNSEQEDAINRIYASSKKLENLIGDILVAQKLDLNKMNFNKVDFDVGEFMNNIVQTYSSVIKDKQIQFKNITTESLMIKTDKDRLSQVFDNLIRNSIDFVPSVGGEIEIGAKSKNDHIEFFVKDNGIGIPKDKQANLFKKFYQIDSSLKRQHGGTGLGLVICKGIVEGLGGKIWLESEPGKGTIVYFSMPKGLDKIEAN